MNAFGNSRPTILRLPLFVGILGTIFRFMRWAGAFLCVWPIFSGQIVSPAFAQGQDFNRIAPKEIPLPPRPAGIVPPNPNPNLTITQPEKVILSELKGLKLIDAARKLVPDGVSGTGIMVDGLPILQASGARSKLSAFLGKPLTFGDLQTISQTIVNWYRQHDHAFVSVAFPEQDVSTGVLQVLVTEFHVGKVRVEGNKWFGSNMLRSDVRLKTGDSIVTSRVNKDLDWLNQNPFRKVELIAEPSDIPGDTDIVLKTQDSFPVRAYVGYDNTGTVLTGRNRWNIGFNWGNAFWQDAQLSYQLTTSDNFWHHRADIPGVSRDPSFTGHSLNYLTPLPWRDKLLIFGSYEESVPRLGDSLGLVGINGQASVRYIWLLPALPHLTHEVQFGYDFKTANNNLQFGGNLISDSTTEIDQFPLVYNATIVDYYGQTTVSNTFVYSPGNLSGANTNTAFQPQSGQSGTPNASAKYVYDTLALARTTNLRLHMSWVMRFTGQISDHNLLPSEQLGAGGVESVRGYDERLANGDDGMLISEELYSPTFNLSKTLINRGIGDQTQVLAFWDYGAVSIKQAPQGQQSNTQLESVGLGLRYSLQNYVTFHLDYGWQLRKPPGALTHGESANVAITVAY